MTFWQAFTPLAASLFLSLIALLVASNARKRLKAGTCHNEVRIICAATTAHDSARIIAAARRVSVMRAMN
jgi:hypothetical protein